MGHKILYTPLIFEGDLVTFSDRFARCKVCGRVEKVFDDGKIVLRTGGFRDRVISRDELIVGEAEIVTEAELISHVNTVERECRKVLLDSEALIKIRRAEHSAIEENLKSALRVIA